MSTQPPTPSRVRIVRPAFYRAAATGSLAPDVRDALIGLTTLADDEGWLLYRPAELAATLYPYVAAARRERDLERRALVLEAAGLLIVHPCGCGQLPTLQRDHAHKGGNKSSAVWGWHSQHPKSEPVRTGTSESVSYSSSLSSSSSSSLSDSWSSSSRAQGALPPRVIDALKKKTNGHFGELTAEVVDRATTFLEGKAINEELLLTYIDSLNPRGVDASATFYLREALTLAGRRA